MPVLLRTVLVLVAFMACVAPVWGQQDRAALVEEIRLAYQQLNYAEAEAKARTALATVTDFTALQLTEIHTLLAFVTYSQNEEEEAEEQFQAALSLTPDLALDPLLVSPKILDFFEGVKRAWEQAEVPNNPGAVRYVLVEDLRAAAAMRSLALPGWGQLYKGENTKGWALLGIWGTAASGTVLAHLIRKQAEDDYLAATDEVSDQEIQDRFDRFNKWHKMRNNLALATAGLWAYSYLDALIFRGVTDAASRRQFTLLPAPAPAYAQVHFRLRF